MTSRPTSCILGILAAETRELAQMAHRIDALLPEVIAKLPKTGDLNLRDLQRIDALGQYLNDIARVLDHLALNLPGASPQNIPNLVETVVLDDFKRRLMGHPAPSPQDPDDRQPLLF